MRRAGLAGMTGALDRPIAVTVFPDLSGRVKHEIRMTPRELARHIETTVAPEKHKLLLIKLATFGDRRTGKGSLRHDDNLLEVHGIEADYDGQVMTPEDMAESLRQNDVAALVYTSPSHTDDHPRFRVLAPFDKPLPPPFRVTALNRLQGLINCDFGPESWVLSQAYFIGSVAGTPPPRVWLVDSSRTIDQATDLDAAARGKPSKGNGAPAQCGSAPLFTIDAGNANSANVVAEMEAIRTGCGSHDALVRLAGRWAAAGMGADDIAAVLRTALLARDPAGRDANWQTALDDLLRLAEWVVAKEQAKTSLATPSATAPSSIASNWPVMHDAAFHGLPGEIVRLIAPHTESDPVAILLHTLVFAGNAIGRGPYYLVESDRHHTNLFAVLVGKTGKARKGTSESRVRSLFAYADADWETRIDSGIASGEGLIWKVRDPIEKVRGGAVEIIDDGVFDKRLMMAEREFAGALEVMKREGNIVSRVVRDAWDRGNLSNLTKNMPARATAAHISIIGHITVEELQASLDRTSMLNGYANRFLYAVVRRAPVLLPHGGDLGEAEIIRAGYRLADALTAARALGRIEMDDDAREAWTRVYPVLSEDRPGLLGAVTARAEAQTIRLALLYALLDGKLAIAVEHLRAALAVWEYSDASAQLIFGDLQGEPVADAILQGLRNAGAAGLTRTDLSNLFQRHQPAYRIDRAVAKLLQVGKIRRVVPPPGRGRPPELWVAV
jgi:hypothetical protein